MTEPWRNDYPHGLAVIGWEFAEPLTLEWRSGVTHAWWGQDFDKIATSALRLARIWNGSLGGGPEDFRLVPDAEIADSLYDGRAGQDGVEQGLGGSQWRNNGNRYGPFWKEDGSIVVPSDRPVKGYWLKLVLGFAIGGIVSLPVWSHYRIGLRLNPPPDPTFLTYSINLGNSLTTYESYSFTANDASPNPRDTLVSSINASSVIATATAETDTRDMYLQAINTGYPIIPSIPGGSSVSQGSSSTPVPSITTSGPTLNWTPITETVEL